METKDGRQLSHQTLEELRILCVKKVLDGEHPEDVITTVGMNPRTIYKWIEKYNYGGFEALKAKPVPGRPPKLNSVQLRWLAKTIRDKNPLQLKFEFALWTVAAVREVIRDRFSVKLSEVSVGRVLKSLGFTPQRPLHRAWQQDPELVENWLATEYPKIREEARKARAQIFFGDESNIRSDYHSGTTWAPKGETPVVEVTGRRFSLNMISAVSPTGYLRFMIVDGKVGAKTFCDFLRRLVGKARKKIFLILDQHPIHKAKCVKKLVEDLKGKLTIFFLPPYSPDLNPDELVWGYVKGKIGRRAIQDKEELASKVLGSLRSLQKRKKLVKGFFGHPSCSYAAS